MPPPKECPTKVNSLLPIRYRAKRIKRNLHCLFNGMIKKQKIIIK